MFRRAFACPRCGTANSRLEALCNRCGTPLPWAERLERAAKFVRDTGDQAGIGIVAVVAPTALWLIGGYFNAALQSRFFPLISAVACCWYAPIFLNGIAFSRGWLPLVSDTPARLIAVRLTLLTLLSGVAYAFWNLIDPAAPGGGPGV